MSDTGPAIFMDINRIVYIRSAPYHPSTNGLVEHTVQIYKEGMKHLEEGSLETHMARFLSKYRSKSIHHKRTAILRNVAGPASQVMPGSNVPKLHEAEGRV